jgi:hypothetical protein
MTGKRSPLALGTGSISNRAVEALLSCLLPDVTCQVLAQVLRGHSGSGLQAAAGARAGARMMPWLLGASCQAIAELRQAQQQQLDAESRSNLPGARIRRCLTGKDVTQEWLPSLLHSIRCIFSEALVTHGMDKMSGFALA